jgi:hypothetical protein
MSLRPILELNPRVHFKSPMQLFCTFDHDISQSDSLVGMACNKNLKGRANFTTFTARDALLSFGPVAVPEKRIGHLEETLFSCTGK